jgi:EAL domain-containing protein (putative c-di-GMP-specific phosphodiesterase class I)/GGDEF domain-containing protein
MRELLVYDVLSRVRWLGYRGKMMLVAFIGTHIPLLTLLVAFVLWLELGAGVALVVIGIALAATLAGTGLTLFILDRLLRPILLTSRALRRFVLHRELPDLPTQYHDDAGTLMADTAASLARLDDVLDVLANYDAGTGLPNRDQFARHLGLRLAGPERPPLAVCALRLANLGSVASSFDRAQADAFVRCFAGRLEATLPQGSLLARIEEAVFAFCLDDAGDTDRIAAELRRIAEETGAEISVGTIRMVPEISGAVTLAPADGNDSALLIDNLRTVLPGASSARPLAPTFFSPSTRALRRERFMLEQELRRAVAEEQLLLHYQPVVDLAVGRVVGAEALVRWRHPERGLIPPGRFIPLAESSALIDEIGLWVLRTACKEARDWQRGGLPQVKVAVNLSVRQLHDPRLVREVADALAASGLTPGCLELELTETAAMEDGRRTLQAFSELRELGVKLAIDDFGAGYSNLTYLRNLPFDRLKIDREFVSGVADHRASRAICRALIALASGLNIEVLGEGVETLDELRTLQSEGCTVFQGFFFARPLPIADFMAQAASASWPTEPAAVAA